MSWRKFRYPGAVLPGKLRAFFAYQNEWIGTSAGTLFSCTMTTIRGIKQDLLRLLLELGKNSHPKEFAALLKEEDGVISELNLLPGTITGSASASIFFDMMPLGTHTAGSAHSHPNGVLRPSNADVNFFPRAGRYHLIIGSPYREHDWRCFTADGEPCDLAVIP